MADFAPETFKKELINILDYWEKYAVDRKNGGFYGRVNYENEGIADAPKAVVITSRILWTYSMAKRLLNNPKYLTLADRAFQDLSIHFIDAKEGGVFWSTEASGKPLEMKKQVYGNAFAMYGLSEYYRATNFPPALERAKEIFYVLEKHAFDPVNGGYREAFARDWSETDDYILSKSPYIKSMNTHLHLVEAYTNLYRIWPDKTLKKQTAAMLEAILDHIVNNETSRMELFFTEKWESKDKVISYGHDIEASWLLYETAEVLKDEKLLKKTRDRCIKMAIAVSTGLSPDGALNYEYDPETKHTKTERSWWVAAEQLVGFYNAYQLTKNADFKVKAERSWAYIDSKFIDRERGEWFGAVKEDGTQVRGDKVNFWKCPYHNARACAEMWKRLEKNKK
ncbi:AGE family epimerase/isomerase [Dyadobacter frigoris]|uniref:Cellobiose 2-epimerase n=1 Tax=Dyadobacter frigoris TaxID=2576211 RepID=A0A4U6D2U5_9BACT|nr:AGE family epimerase/isomerase [Dyadobacter frigoris]TKT90956.1 N-acyl-D-glucosamine 2-epimerase [Dyadobacter frigoris]GLU56143.1 cellobiose 2-epimerase [Dyadobacter frigoris]